MILDYQTVELLEFEKIRDSIASFAKSVGGATLIRGQGFETCIEKLDYQKDIVSDWKNLLTSDIKSPDLYFPDTGFIKKIETEGFVLEGVQIADIAVFIKSTEILKKFCLKDAENINKKGALRAEAEKLPDLGSISKEILKELNPDGSVKDNHPLLKEARAKIASLHSKISKASAKYFSQDQGIWQSQVATQRDGRIVLPLKSNYRSRVKGIINEVSSSGATIFIEPFEIVELNNEMTIKQNELKLQVFKIYKNLTAKLRENVTELFYLCDQIYFLDSWYARALYSIRNSCIRPLKADKGIILKKGRHPGLGNTAVPVSLSFNEEVRILIITGPNAGGKTVTLKTCGLFVLMNQFACEIPAEEGTAIGLYSNIYADIGDDQSIEQSLSTFSGHMNQISRIVENADRETLVLLDELGSGTDPAQGSAIAMGILDFLINKNISTIVTTHHSAVKNFGYTNEGAVNASVAFDSDTLKPTYQIIEGVPGESHALEIAKDVGVPSVILESAEKYISNENNTVTGMIHELEKRQSLIYEKEKQLSDKSDILKEDRRLLDLKNLKLRQLQNELDRKDYGKLKFFIEEQRKELENLVRELREGEITREKNLKVKNKIKELNEKLETEKKAIDKKKPEPETSEIDYNLKTGDEVLYKKNRKKGVLLEKRKKDTWLVAFGNIKLPIDKKELEPIKKKNTKSSFADTAAVNFSVSTKFELDLRGFRVFEAEEAVIKQIDAALLSGLNEFSIIHGLGEGILQKAVHDFLRENSAVENFSFSDPDQGGFGKTIVRLK